MEFRNWYHALSVFKCRYRVGICIYHNTACQARKGGFIIKIASSTIGMESERQYAELRMDAYSATSWGKSGTVKSFAELALGLNESEVSDGSSTGNESAEKSGADSNGSLQDTADSIRAHYEAMKANIAQSDREADSLYLELKAMCVNFLLKLLFGIEGEDGNEGFSYGSAAGAAGFSNEGGSYVEYHYNAQSETTSFQTTGTALTEDGRQIQFGLNVTMSRQFVEESGVEVDFGTPQYCDPLVVNLSGNPGTVSDQTFAFDIDSDGVEDRINRLVGGTGFLALDSNGDGVINDGSELFGTQSGDGFEDLAKYDDDGNGWIDENDEIFSRLKIWTTDSSGKDALVDLKSSDVGAICLRSVQTDFSVNNSATNAAMAQVRSTGFFLHESSGNAGSIQQFDMVRQAYA